MSALDVAAAPAAPAAAPAPEVDTTAAAAADPAVSAADVAMTEVKPHKKAQPKSKYRVLCCGNSALDLLLIPLCLVGVYVLTGILFALCIHAVVETDDSSTALWIFFGVFVTFVVMLTLVLGTTAYEKRMLQKYAVEPAVN
ncbi:hypothetical protein PybrP1_011691 [[Pythium] brassicae (nom. inval.)]|nr:hypothetical protein PybrP1_011691 [[Pythium] brassicae (nom. inval.)]